MADVRLENVSKKFGNVEAVAAFSETVPVTLAWSEVTEVAFNSTE
jgi:hypothetical protein